MNRRAQKRASQRVRRRSVIAAVIGFAILMGAGLTTVYTDSINVGPSTVIDTEVPTTTTTP